MARSRPLFGIRTQSGSFISNISKQPTPAPSSPGMETDDIPYGMNDDDIFGNHGEDDAGAHVNSSPNFLSTPETTPANPRMFNGIADLTQEVERFKLLATEAQKRVEDSERALSIKVSHYLTLHLNYT